MKWLFRLCSVVVLALLACGPTEIAAPECDRNCLVRVGHAVVASEQPLTPSVRMTEGGSAVKPADSWLAHASDLDIHDEYTDPATGTVIIVGSGTDVDGRASVFGLRLRLDAETVTEAELIVAHNGEASLFPPEVPVPRQDTYGSVVPPESRTRGARMIEIANAYFDGIEVDSGADVPVASDCNRIENGVQTTSNEMLGNLKCNSLEVFDYITEVRERRFPVVDEERGVVAALVAFFIPGGDYTRVVDGMETSRHYDSRSLFLIEGFKIEDGQIKLIEATMRNMPVGTSMGWSDK
jgi:hypothetical protein